jgi:hypothetical protein
MFLGKNRDYFTRRHEYTILGVEKHYVSCIVEIKYVYIIYVNIMLYRFKPHNTLLQGRHLEGYG